MSYGPAAGSESPPTHHTSSRTCAGCASPIGQRSELRLIGGLWYEIRLAPSPELVYRTYHETHKLQLKPYDRKSPIIEIEIKVRRLITPAVQDAVSGAMIAAGPETDDEESWKRYRRKQPDRYYAIAKRVISRRELRRHRLSNASADIGYLT